MALLKPREPITRATSAGVAIATVAVAIVVWSWLSYGGVVNHLFLPSPTEVLSAFYELAESGELWMHAKASVQIILMGWALASIIAVPVGILVGSFGLFDALFSPFASFIRYLPVSALIPLIILYVGIDDASRVTVIFIGTFFQMVLMVADAAANSQKDLIDSAYTLGAKRVAVVTKVILPSSLPGIMDALRINMGAAWTYLVVAEIIAADKGLGYMILNSMRGLFVAKIFVGLLVIGLLGFMADRLFEYLHRTLLPWSTKAA